jgi:hypothetical protein
MPAMITNRVSPDNHLIEVSVSLSCVMACELPGISMNRIATFFFSIKQPAHDILPLRRNLEIIELFTKPDADNTSIPSCELLSADLQSL